MKDAFAEAEAQHELLRGYIDVTGIDLLTLVKKAYELSVPAGMGFLHFQPGPLPDHIAPRLVGNEDSDFPVNLDYVAGRGVKLTVTRNGGRLYVPDRWFDHSAEQYSQLLATVGIDKPAHTLQDGLR